MKRIEPSRKHGPFDPRWIALRRLNDAERIDEEWLRTSIPVALKTWESEGGAVLQTSGVPRDRRAGAPAARREVRSSK